MNNERLLSIDFLFLCTLALMLYYMYHNGEGRYDYADQKRGYRKNHFR